MSFRSSDLARVIRMATAFGVMPSTLAISCCVSPSSASHSRRQAAGRNDDPPYNPSAADRMQMTEQAASRDHPLVADGCAVAG